MDEHENRNPLRFTDANDASQVAAALAQQQQGHVHGLQQQAMMQFEKFIHEVNETAAVLNVQRQIIDRQEKAIAKMIGVIAIIAIFILGLLARPLIGH